MRLSWWILFSNSLACDMWTQDYYTFLSELDNDDYSF